MTLAEVKDNLPDVKVNVRGEICDGIVRGRKLRFPKVWVPEKDIVAEWTWDAIQHSVNTGRPLSI